MFDWQRYALGEAGAKILSSVFQKIAGLAITLPATALIYSMIIGFVQISVGLVRYKEATDRMRARKDAVLSCLVGAFAAVANVLGPVAFLYGADLAGRTFILSMSVIPGLILGQVLFSQYLRRHQYVAILLFVIGAWAILDGPNLWHLVRDPPLWVMLTLVLTLTGALSESVKMTISKDYCTMNSNFWIGCSTVFLSLGLYVGLLVLLPANASLHDIGARFIGASVVTGGIVVVMITMGLRSYQTGAFIVLKKILMTSTYLIGSALVGRIVFDEPLTVLRCIGVVIFVIAVFLSDQRAYTFVQERIRS